MGTKYHVYSNGGSGPIDYSTPVATVAGTSWASPPLAAGSSTDFAVRAFDDTTGLEESNVDARVRVTLDGSGLDASATPTSPALLGVTPLAGGSARVDWAHSPATGSAPATSFAVFATVGASVDYTASPAATATATGPGRYSATITGLSEGVVHAVGVRAVNAAGRSAPGTEVAVTGSASPPSPIDSLTATASP